MVDMRFEQRRQWVEQVLRELPFLDAAQRRFLSVPLMRTGWQVLIDRQGGLGRAGRANAFAVGPSGVFALVFTDTVPETSELRRIRNRAEETFSNLGAGRGQYVPHMIDMLLLMTRAVAAKAETSFTAVDLNSLPGELFSGEARLTKQRAREIAYTVAERSSRYELLSTDDAPQGPAAQVSEGLFAATDLREDLRAKALDRPFEEWMIFLDPNQMELVIRNYNGPARFSGPAGTGKTVVALHRMARFAKHNPGRLLFTSFVRNLPDYHRSGFVRLAPHAGDRAEFVGLYGWTMRFLKDRGVAFNLDNGAAETAFSQAWRDRARMKLESIESNPGYWKDEIQRVIKGRGITTLTRYQDIDRTGRNGISLDDARRETVWKDLFVPYQARLKERGVCDFIDVIAKAFEELRAAPLDDPYGLVVVDEVQDFTLLELKLVHQIAGGEPTAPLVLVGDGQQQVYAGGWRLSDAGIPIVGRGAVLKINYRNRAAVHEYARAIDAGNSVDDLDGAPGVTLRDTEVVLPGGTAKSETFPRREAESRLVQAIRASGRALADIAVILNTNREVDRVSSALRRAQIPTRPLESFDGTYTEAVKIGTVHRAKGMDFLAVFHLTDAPASSAQQLTGAERDRAELAARQRMVALTRARDYIWIGYTED
ncbi:UvrD-helicase domain-containing protein [Nocardia acidivorans]|uniref:UvrD-helicase domain-containing protein n=1 Tax=Nocardia acidivorans TaxID=404580 RepID=UPI00082F3D8F|nr:UvrD-helicase domain-containing protein [Nocardia acidivorans]